MLSSNIRSLTLAFSRRQIFRTPPPDKLRQLWVFRAQRGKRFSGKLNAVGCRFLNFNADGFKLWPTSSWTDRGNLSERLVQKTNRDQFCRGIAREGQIAQSRHVPLQHGENRIRPVMEVAVIDRPGNKGSPPGLQAFKLLNHLILVQWLRGKEAKRGRPGVSMGGSALLTLSPRKSVGCLKAILKAELEHPGNLDQDALE